MLTDLRLALRHYRLRPGFPATVVVTLALAIGATTAIFSVVSRVLIRALPFDDPDRLVWIASVRPDNTNAPFSLPEFMDYRGETRTLAGLAAYAYWSANLAGDGETERLQGARMSANAFDVLGLTPAAGRLLTVSDDRPDAPKVVVISHRLWQRRFAGAIDIIGAPARINAEPYLIVGVLPVQFPLPLSDIDVVTALVPDRDPLRHLRNSTNFLRMFGRLRPEVSLGQAEAELTGICRSLRQRFPVEYARKDAVGVHPLHEVVIGDARQPLLALLTAVLVVLTTALTNLASLALVRASGRRPELSMRMAVGASRRQLTRQLTTEAAVLAIAGSGLGSLVAAVMIGAAKRWAPPSIPRLDEVSVDVTVVFFVVALTAVVTVLLTVAPLSTIARAGAGDALRPVSRGAIGDRWNHRFRAVMVIAEIAAALVLVLATIALVQRLIDLQSLHAGFNPDQVLQARVSLSPGYRSADDLSRFYERLAERIASAPNVTHVGVVSVAPLSGLLRTVPFSIAGQPVSERERSMANLRTISPGYLPAVGTRLLRGRYLTETDRDDTPHVALVSAALADRFLPEGGIGARILINDNNQGPRSIEIVGIVENVRQSALDLPPELDIYIPLRQIHPDGVGLLRSYQFWMVRTDADPAAFQTAFVAYVRAVDPDAAVSDPRPMRQFVDAWLGPLRFSLALLSAFALTAVLLAVVGLYGLVSYAVGQRAPEIGLRIALGARPSDVQRMILRQGAWLSLGGVAVGLGVAALAWPLVLQVIQDVTIGTGAAMGTAAILVVVVIVAAWLPAARAARIDPSVVLKAGY